MLRCAEERAFYGTEAGREALAAAFQDILDRYRARDVAAELHRRRARHVSGAAGNLNRLPSGDAGSEDDAGWFDGPRGSRAPSVAYSGNGEEAGGPGGAAEAPADEREAARAGAQERPQLADPCRTA